MKWDIRGGLAIGCLTFLLVAFGFEASLVEEVCEGIISPSKLVTKPPRSGVVLVATVVVVLESVVATSVGVLLLEVEVEEVEVEVDDEVEVELEVKVGAAEEEELEVASADSWAQAWEAARVSSEPKVRLLSWTKSRHDSKICGMSDPEESACQWMKMAHEQVILQSREPNQ